jgi:hypothetical protein
MGAIKDLTDLVIRLLEKADDRKFAAELREVQKMIASIQSEHAAIHEQRIALMSENADLKQQIANLKQQLVELKGIQHRPDGDVRLETTAEKILLAVAHSLDAVSRDQFVPELQLPLPKVHRYFDQLSERGLVIQVSADGPLLYEATPEGRAYLDRAGLL